jgi:hypothetical protein
MAWRCPAFAIGSPLAAIALAAGMMAAALTSPAQAQTTPSDSPSFSGGQLLTQLGVTEQYRPDYPTALIGHRLVFAQYDKTGNAKEIISLDPETREGSVIASGLHNPEKIFFSDSAVTVVLEAGRLTVFDNATGKRRFHTRLAYEVKAATIVGNELWAAGSPSFALGLSRYDLSTGAKISERVSEHSPGGSQPIFWKDKLVAVTSGQVALYDGNLAQLASAPAPKSEIYGNLGCTVHAPAVHNDLLIYQVSCGRIAVFDLKRFTALYELERFDPSPFVAFDVVGDKLFVVPTEEQRKSKNGAVFDLATGRRLAVLPIDASGIAIRGAVMAAYLPRPSYNKRPIGFYRIDVSALGEDAQDKAVVEAHARAAAILERSGSVEDAIDAIEGASLEPLLARGSLGKEARAIALDYGAWLALTLDRREKGIALLEKLAAATPDDPVSRRRLGSAWLRDYLLTDAPESLRQARRLLAAEPDSPLAQLAPAPPPVARATPVDFGAFADHILFWRDKMVIGRWDEAPSVALYDRATLRPLSVTSIRPSDDEQQDAVGGITFAGEQVLAWLNYRYEDAKRANLAIIDPQHGRVTLRSIDESVASRVVETPKGIATCPDLIGQHCVLRDAKSFAAITEPFDCRLMELAGSASADQATLGDLVAGGCKAAGGDDPLAVSKDWIVTAGGHWPGPYSVAFRRLSGDGSWQSTDLKLAQWHGMIIPPGRDFAVAANQGTETVRYSRLDLPSGVARTLLQLHVSRDVDRAWIANDRLLLVGLGHDIVVYDLENARLAGVLHGVIPNAFTDNGHGVDLAKITRIMIDGDHVIALTFRGEFTRLLYLPDLLRFAAEKGREIAAADAALRR